MRSTSLGTVTMLVMSIGLIPPLHASAWAPNQSLADADSSFLGEAEENSSGAAIANSGDINGDGLDDVVIGANTNSEGGEHAGQVYIFFGSSAGWSMDTGLAEADASLVGETDWDYVGAAIAGVGDVNGDNIDDLLIGAPFDDQPGGDPAVCCDGAGVTYLVLGKASGWAMDIPISQADASFWGEVRWDYSGEWVSGAGDVDADGLDDFLIVAPANDEAGTDSGQAYLFLGRSDGWRLGISLADADSSFLGDGRDDYSWVASGAGDVNGDGFDDFLIGSPHHENESLPGSYGQVYLFFGGTTGWEMDTSFADADASFVAEQLSAGQSWVCGAGPAAGAGDVNGDGFDDILIGGPGHDEIGMDAGKAFLFLGRAGDWTMETSLSDADLFLYAERAGDEFGTHVAGAGDVDGDGYDDFLVSARMNDDGGTSAGKTYLYFGGVGIAGDSPPFSASFVGEDVSDRTGDAIAGQGDVNGDGLDDFLVGAPQSNEGGLGVGQTYLILGKACPDEDGDNWTPCEGDCDDGDSAVHPGAVEICNGGVDDDCDSNTDEVSDLDGDGQSVCAGDCDDSDPSVGPDELEDCEDSIDNDCDGAIDADDSDCDPPADDDQPDDDQADDDDDGTNTGAGCECRIDPNASPETTILFWLAALLGWKRRSKALR
jgi:hypothetical protein